MENCSSYKTYSSQYEPSIEGNKHVNVNFESSASDCTSFYMLVSYWVQKGLGCVNLNIEFRVVSYKHKAYPTNKFEHPLHI